MTEKNIQALVMVALSKYGTPIRLNSGKAWGGSFTRINGTPVIKDPRPIKLCPEGTPDIMCILPKGEILWIECKQIKGQQRNTQKRFQEMLVALGHKYIIARKPEDIHNYFNKGEIKIN